MAGRDWNRFAWLALAFLAWHVPLLFRTAAGQDEDWYGVPGITIVRSGLPRVPYLPARDPSQVCYRADELLYVLPPLSYYLQAAVHLVLGDGLGQARLASAIEAVLAALVVFRLGLLWFGDPRGALLSAGAFLFSRVVSFPATMARPDMAAALFGLLAIGGLARYRRDRRQRSLLAAGLAAGLSLLAHPIGIVPAAQVALALLCEPAPVSRRAADLLIFAGLALGVLGLWAPLIALHPDIFRSQFGYVVDRAAAGLGTTLLSPLLNLAYQAELIARHVRPFQALLYLMGYAWAVGWARRREPAGREFVYHLLASLLILMVIAGRHPGVNYYAFPAAFASLAVGMLASRAVRALERRRAEPRALPSLLIAGALALALVPGSGIQALLAHLRHWNDPDYDAHAFTRRIMADLPADGLVAVDGTYVMDFYLAGRPVVVATVYPRFFDARREPFQYVVFGRVGLEIARPLMDDLTFIRSYGARGDLFAPYAELYRRVPPETAPAPGERAPLHAAPRTSRLGPWSGRLLE